MAAQAAPLSRAAQVVEQTETRPAQAGDGEGEVAPTEGSAPSF